METILAEMVMCGVMVALLPSHHIVYYSIIWRVVKDKNYLGGRVPNMTRLELKEDSIFHVKTPTPNPAP